MSQKNDALGAGASSKPVGVFGKIIGRKPNDGVIATSVKVLTPYGSVLGAVDSISESKQRLSALMDDVGNKANPSSGIKLSDAVINPEIDPAVIAVNIDRMRGISKALLLVGMFVAVDVSMFLAFGYWVAGFSAPAAVLCYILAGKYAFIARAFKDGEFSHPTLLAFLLDRKNKWVSNLFFGEA